MKKSELFQDIYLDFRRILRSQDPLINRQLKKILQDDTVSETEKIACAIVIYNEYVSITHTAAITEVLSRFIAVENDIDLSDREKVLMEIIKSLKGGK